MSNLTIRQLLESGAHFGHRTDAWDPRMAPFIYGKYKGLHIINLEKTFDMINEVLAYVSSLSGKVLFVGTKYSARDAIKEEAERCGMPYINHRWLGGTLTNYKTIIKSIKRLKSLEDVESRADFEGLTKKERLGLLRERDKLVRSLGGIKNMGALPDAIFIVDVMREHTALKEANKLGIPVVAIVDTNANPEGVDYVIPANDDAIGAVKLYLSTIADTIIKAREAAAPKAVALAEEENSLEEGQKTRRKVVKKVVVKTKVSSLAKPASSKEKEKTASVSADTPADNS